jgi:hypothetical protein
MSSIQPKQQWTVTIDTNVLLGGLDGPPDQREAFENLIRLCDKGIVNIGLSSRFEKDKERDIDIERVKRDYAIARRFPEIPAPFRLGVSRLGHDLLVEEETSEVLHEIFGVEDIAAADQNTIWDIDHLYAHYAASHDVFLTWERAILAKADRLEAIGIRVMNPAEFNTLITTGQGSTRST